MKTDILSKEGKSTGRDIELADEIFGQEPNEHAVYLAIKAYNAAQHRGTHSSKERWAVKGSTKKIKKQKGTGTARAGDIKNPLFRGGGRVFGPRVRTYGIKLNKKVSKLARRSVFSQLVSDGKLKVVEDFKFDAPKTKAFTQVLTGLNANEHKSLFVFGEPDRNVYLSSRNIRSARVISADELNIYDLLDAQEVLLTESAVQKVTETLA